MEKEQSKSSAPFEHSEPLDIREFSKTFATRIIKLHQYLTSKKDVKDFNLPKVVLLKGTSIGSLIREADSARGSVTQEEQKDSGASKERKAVARQKYLEALMAARSTRYYLEIISQTGYLKSQEAESIIDDATTLVRYLYVMVHGRKKEGGAE